VFSSMHGVRNFVARLDAAGLDSRAFASARVAAVGPATEEALVGAGIRPDLVPAGFTGEALARALGEGSGTVLLPRPERAPRLVIEILEAAGWKTREAVAYVTVPARADTPEADEARQGRFDAVAFTSGSTARNFVDVICKPGDIGLSSDHAEGPKVVCIGPVTADVARDLGFRVDAVADVHTIDGLARALVAVVGDL
jgi:uroporphyrinogen III methyltransferase/synthase